MLKLRDLGKDGKKNIVVAGNTDFKFFPCKDGVARVYTDTIISLNHEQKEGESIDEFRQRIVETVYESIKKACREFPDDMDKEGIAVSHFS